MNHKTPAPLSLLRSQAIGKAPVKHRHWLHLLPLNRLDWIRRLPHPLIPVASAFEREREREHIFFYHQAVQLQFRSCNSFNLIGIIGFFLCASLRLRVARCSCRRLQWDNHGFPPPSWFQPSAHSLLIRVNKSTAAGIVLCYSSRWWYW